MFYTLYVSYAHNIALIGDAVVVIGRYLYLHAKGISSNVLPKCIYFNETNFRPTLLKNDLLIFLVNEWYPKAHSG